MSDFPSLDASASAKAVVEDCSLLYQKGESDTKAEKYNEESVLSMLGSIPQAQYDLYRYAYRMGRYVAYSGWSGDRVQLWSEEAGRAIALGLDDALAGRGRSTSYTSKTSGWSADDMSSLSYLYTAAYDEGREISGAAPASNKGMLILAGLVAATGIAGTMYLMSRRSSHVIPLEQERYANPSSSLGEAVWWVHEVRLYPSNENDWVRESAFYDGNGKTIWVEGRRPGVFTEVLLGRTDKIEPREVTKKRKRNPSEYANPAPGMTVQSLLFNREAWDVGMAKRWAKNHNYRSDDVDVKPNTIRMRQADPKHFQKKTMRTIQFGEDSGIQAVVARPKR